MEILVGFALVSFFEAAIANALDVGVPLRDAQQFGGVQHRQLSQGHPLNPRVEPLRHEGR